MPANATGPIPLIDGEKLIGLLIDNGIGVRTRNVVLLELAPDEQAGVGPVRRRIRQCARPVS